VHANPVSENREEKGGSRKERKAREEERVEEAGGLPVYLSFAGFAFFA
jgi:hypothetical protein